MGLQLPAGCILLGRYQPILELTGFGVDLGRRSSALRPSVQPESNKESSNLSSLAARRRLRSMLWNEGICRNARNVCDDRRGALEGAL